MLKYLFIGGGTIALFAGASQATKGLYTHLYQVPGIVLRLTGTVLSTVVRYVARGCKPRTAGWTLEGELQRSILRCCMMHYPSRYLTPENAAYTRHLLDKLVKHASEATARSLGLSVERFIYHGLEHIWLRAREAEVAKGKQPHRVVLLYLHGGGFAMGSPTAYVSLTSRMQTRIRDKLALKLGQDVRVDVLVANYRKTPEFPYPVPPQDCYAMYKFLLETERLSPSQIVVMGDSAGGALTMTTLLRARDEDVSLVPAAAIVTSPFVDRSHRGNSRDAPYDVLSAETVEATWDAYDPQHMPPEAWGDMSPVHCDLRGLPPVYIQAMELEYLLPHSKTLYAKALEAGLTGWTLEIVPNMPHAYTTLPISAWPTAPQSLDNTSEFAATQLARSAMTKH
jgi:acetyl esterase/lipase